MVAVGCALQVRERWLRLPDRPPHGSVFGARIASSGVFRRVPAWPGTAPEIASRAPWGPSSPPSPWSLLVPSAGHRLLQTSRGLPGSANCSISFGESFLVWPPSMVSCRVRIPSHIKFRQRGDPTTATGASGMFSSAVVRRFPSWTLPANLPSPDAFQPEPLRG
jgi:hypothetical protein